MGLGGTRLPHASGSLAKVITDWVPCDGHRAEADLGGDGGTTWTDSSQIGKSWPDSFILAQNSASTLIKFNNHMERPNAIKETVNSLQMTKLWQLAEQEIRTKRSSRVIAINEFCADEVAGTASDIKIMENTMHMKFGQTIEDRHLSPSLRRSCLYT
ncbi:hypothetical protein MSG28_015700 [Choristoneura fumiferana]|uniref:Uncharacterized protein n=1 Tax=Choristoneura fumiferana TaxID=7141 RepID=A0ACC0KBL7_CHOFU|nr:hypothetical protein MSG28_015700 [Choristoneura fumiferana]